MQDGNLGAASAAPVPPHFRTDDLALAAALHAEGFSLVSVETVGKKAYFIFVSERDIVVFVEDYHDGNVEVEPRRLLQAAAHCRNIMFAALDAARPRRKPAAR